MTVELKVSLPDDVYRALAAVADKRGVRASDVVAGLVGRDVRPLIERMTATARDRTIRTLHSKGWSDRRIGERVGMSHTAVKKIRDRLNLPRNYAPGGKEKAA